MLNIRLKMTALCLSVMSFMLGVPEALAQDGKPFVIVGSETYHIKSEANQAVYEIQIRAPLGYQKEMCNHMATLYQTDGNWSFAGAVQIAQRLQMVKSIPPTLVVGIGYPTSDFKTAGKRRQDDLAPVSKYTSTGFGAKAFTSFIKQQVMPFVESKYCRTNDRIISGFSLGGTFAAHALFNNPDMFNRYLIGSPNLVLLNNGEIFKAEEAYAKNHKDMDKHVYLSTGSLEGKQMVPYMFKLAYTLEDRHYPSLKLTYSLADNEDHMTYGMMFLGKALKNIFADKGVEKHTPASRRISPN